MRKQLSEKPTTLYVGLGGTIGLVLIFVLEPFMPQALSLNVPEFLQWLTTWWCMTFVVALALGQLKINRPNSSDDQD